MNAVCLFVCLSVTRITQKDTDRFSFNLWNLQLWIREDLITFWWISIGLRVKILAHLLLAMSRYPENKHWAETRYAGYFDVAAGREAPRWVG